jgi:hypothetical protein
MKRRVLRVALLFGCSVGIALAGCKKEARIEPVAASASAPGPGATAAPPAPEAKTSASFSGTYTAKAAEVSLGKGEKAVQWPDNPASGAVGPGTIDLVVREPRGEVRGEANGALGNMVVSGEFDGHDLRATLIPKDPNAEDAMTGVMTLSQNGTALRGTLRVSGKDARVVREASVELSRK